MDCKLVRDMAYLYLDGEIAAEDRIDLEEHLHYCYSCREYYHKISTESLTIKNIVSSFVPTPSLQFREKIDLMFETKNNSVFVPKKFLTGAVVALSIILSIFIIGITTWNTNPISTKSHYQTNKIKIMKTASYQPIVLKMPIKVKPFLNTNTIANKTLAPIFFANDFLSYPPVAQRNINAYKVGYYPNEIQ